MNKVEIKGVYPFENDRDPLHVVELSLHGCGYNAEMISASSQGGPRHLRYVDHLLSSDGSSILGDTADMLEKPALASGSMRIACMIANLDLNQPLETTYGSIDLPQPQSLPERLVSLRRKVSCNRPIPPTSNCWTVTDESVQHVCDGNIRPGPLIVAYAQSGKNGPNGVAATFPRGTIFEVVYYAFGRGRFNYAVHFGPHEGHPRKGYLSPVDSCNSGRYIDMQDDPMHRCDPHEGLPDPGPWFKLCTRGQFVLQGEPDVPYCWFDPLFSDLRNCTWRIYGATLVVSLIHTPSE